MSFDENESRDNVVKTSVVKEQVKPKFKRKLKRFLGVVFSAVVAAVVFGFVARLVFIKSEGLALKIFGIEKEADTDKNNSDGTNKVQVAITEYYTGQDSATPVPTDSVVIINTKDPEPQVTPVTAVVDDKDDLSESTENQAGLPDTTGTDLVTDIDKTEGNTDVSVDNANSGNTEKTESDKNEDNLIISQGQGIVPVVPATDVDQGITLEAYVSMMSQLREMTDNIQRGIVTVKSRTSTVNWMGDDMENITTTFGGYFADNGMDYLFVTYYDRVMNADSISVVLCTGTEYKANLFERDTNYNLAVVAVPIRTVSEEDKASIEKLVCGSSEDIYAGMPIIALGSPNGNPGSLEYGFITGCGDRFYVMDGELSVFTTDITNSAESEGIIVNYSGEVVGVISRALEVPQRSFANSSFTIDSLLDVIVEMCNGRERPLVGIRAEIIPDAALAELGQENGIYINDVASGSPADEAGIRKGDIILAINGEKVNSVAGFMAAIMEGTDNDGIELDIYRGSRVSGPDMKVTLYPRRK